MKGVFYIASFHFFKSTNLHLFCVQILIEKFGV
jgi:hypothetical protein